MIWNDGGLHNREVTCSGLYLLSCKIFIIKKNCGEERCWVPCESRGLAGSSTQHEPRLDFFPSPVWTTEQESGKGPADTHVSLDEREHPSETRDCIDQVSQSRVVHFWSYFYCRTRSKSVFSSFSTEEWTRSVQRCPHLLGVTRRWRSGIKDIPQEGECFGKGWWHFLHISS